MLVAHVSESLGRRVVGAIVCLVALCLVSGCAIFFPTRPETSGNVALTNVAGHVALVQCVADDFKIESLSVSAVPGGKTGPDHVIYIGNARAGEINMTRGQALALSEPIEGLESSASGDALVNEIPQGSTIYVSIAGSSGRVDESFSSAAPNDLREGMYLYRDGTSGEDPCSDGK